MEGQTKSDSAFAAWRKNSSLDLCDKSWATSRNKVSKYWGLTTRCSYASQSKSGLDVTCWLASTRMVSPWKRRFLTWISTSQKWLTTCDSSTSFGIAPRLSINLRNFIYQWRRALSFWGALTKNASRGVRKSAKNGLSTSPKKLGILANNLHSSFLR